MPSGLLHDSDVRFYHPVDDTTEYTKNLDWTNIGDDYDFVPGILTSGIKTTAGDSFAKIVYTTSAVYTSLSSVSGCTCGIWISGFLGGDSNSRLIDIGLANSSNNIRDGFEFNKTTSTSGFQVISVINNVYKIRNWIPPPSNDTNWHFFVFDLRYETSGWRHLASLDGSEWIDLGVDDNTGTFAGFSRPIIQTLDHVTGPKVVVDEVVLWGGNDLFTAQELSNLYELYNTHNTTMDQYTSIFGTPANSGIDLFIHGLAQVSENISLYIPGQYETKSTNLFIQGMVQTSGNVDLYISGTPPIASSSIDLFLKVAIPANSGIDLYVSGPISVNNNIDHFILGHEITSGNIDTYVQGIDTSSGNIDLYISGVPAISSSIDLYMTGPILSSGDMEQFIKGHATVSGDFLLFIDGSQKFDAFARVVANDPSNSSDLFMHGVPSGVSGISYTNNSISLFINDDGDNDLLITNWSSFTRVADPLTIPHSGNWSSFARVGNISNNNIDLYINAHASGESPRGITIINSSTMFIDGLASQSGNEGLLSDGFFFVKDSILGFARVHLGSSNSLSLYVSGESPIIPPSATLDMSIFGILDIESGSFPSYICGNDLRSSSNDLFVFGILGIESGNIPLYIEVTDTGVLNQQVNLYSHGF